MGDYERTAAVIDYAQTHWREQPDLATLAAVVGLSPPHLHRLFRRALGITPKAFVGCLTALEARERLRRGRSVLDTALAVGLSGAGRRHDLCVRLEAASPGELKRAGAGWTLSAGFTPTPFAPALLATGPQGLCWLSFLTTVPEAAWADLLRAWPGARLERDDAAAATLARRIFSPPPSDGGTAALRAYVRGSVFQVRVWRALLGIGCGRVCTYGDLARAVGDPRAARAVGGAVGSNRLSVLIPCHRVITATGAVGNYGGGPARKRALLAWEAARLAEAP